MNRSQLQINGGKRPTRSWQRTRVSRHDRLWICLAILSFSTLICQATKAQDNSFKPVPNGSPTVWQRPSSSFPSIFVRAAEGSNGQYMLELRNATSQAQSLSWSASSDSGRTDRGMKSIPPSGVTGLFPIHLDAHDGTFYLDIENVGKGAHLTESR